MSTWSLDHFISTKCSVIAALGLFSYKQWFISADYTSASVIVPKSSKYLGLLGFENRFCRGWAWSKCSGFYVFARLINSFCNRAVEFDPKAQEYGHVNGKQLCRVWLILVDSRSIKNLLPHGYLKNFRPSLSSRPRPPDVYIVATMSLSNIRRHSRRPRRHVRHGNRSTECVFQTRHIKYTAVVFFAQGKKRRNHEYLCSVTVCQNHIFWPQNGS